MLNEIKSRFLSGKRILVILALLFAISANAQWVQMNGPNSVDIMCLTVSGTNIFAGTRSGGIYLSTNNGASWTAVNNGLTNLNINALAVSGTNIFAGTFGGVFLSVNNGASWSVVNTGLTNQYVFCLAVSGANIFTGTVNNVFLSTNNGATWNAVSTGLTNKNVQTLIVSGSSIYAGTWGGGVFSSTNNGTLWTATGLTNQYVQTLSVSGVNIFAGTLGSGVFLSSNNGVSWNVANNGLTNLYIKSFAVFETNVIAATSSGVFLTKNNGTIWVEKNQGFNIIPPYINSVLVANNFIFAGPNSDPVWRRSISEIISIQNISTETPSKYSLSQNYPNPFNSTSNLKFQIVNTGDVKLIVYDIMGKEVQTLVNERLQPGTYETLFDGSALNSSVYFYKLVTNGFSETKKMLMIK